MRFLVTGGTGFIGSYTVRKLVEEGHDVVVLDYMPNYNLISNIKDQINIIRGDVSNAVEVFEAVKKNDIEYIIHLANLLTDTSNKYPSKATIINGVGTNNVFDAARLLDVKKVVYASSIAVYGASEQYHEQPVNEDAAARPRGTYGACKLLNEIVGQYYFSEYGLDNIGLRFSQLYGPGRKFGGSSWGSLVIEKPASGEPLIVERPEVEFIWLYVKDAVKSIVLSTFKNPPHKIFNILGPQNTIRAVTNIVKKYLPEAQIKFKLANEINAHERKKLRLDGTRARDELGFESISLEEGVKEHINTVRMWRGLSPI